MRTRKWVGLMSNASPFIIPDGATVDQVNLSSEVPGQVTSRGGMVPVVFSPSLPSVPSVVDCCACRVAGSSYLLLLTSSGSLVAAAAPAQGPDPALPVEPSLAVQGSQTATAYTMRYKSALEDGPPSDT